MKYNCRMPAGMWLIFSHSFKAHLRSVLGYDKKTASSITEMAHKEYRKIIAALPEFDKRDIYQMNAVNSAMLAAFILSMPLRPTVEDLTVYYSDQ